MGDQCGSEFGYNNVPDPNTKGSLFEQNISVHSLKDLFIIKYSETSIRYAKDGYEYFIIMTNQFIWSEYLKYFKC